MAVFDWILVCSWAMFLVTWVGTAWRVKRTVHRGPAMALGVAGFSVVILLLHFMLQRLPTALVSPSPSVGRGVLGSVACVTGVAYAIWARLSLGANWGLPMSRKERPELVTAGPYARVRHPIYAGILLALLGCALVVGIAELFIALAMGPIFW